MEPPLGKRRNVAIIAHGGAGKTTLAGAMLANARRKEKQPSAEPPALDADPEEEKRKLTISPSVRHLRWEDHDVAIIDTPGYSNFAPHTRTALRAADGAIVILSAISGVKVQTERVWEYADENELPRLAFVNKMDMERANFLAAIDDMEKVLHAKGVALDMPVGEGEGFRGVIDLVAMKAFLFSDSGGRSDVADVPEELLAEAGRLRERLIEAAVETDDALTEKYLSGEDIPQEELRRCLREGVLTRRFVPVLCGSAYKNMGVGLLMDAINTLLPSPLDKGAANAIIGNNPFTGGDVKREPDVNSPFSAFVFKTKIDPFTGKLSLLRVFSGKLTHGSTILNSSRGVKEKTAHIFTLDGDRVFEVREAHAGDIVALSKLKDTHTGDTLCDVLNPITFPPLPPQTSLLSYAIAPKTKADEEKVPSAMEKLMEEDPTIELKRDDETKEFILSGTGQVHLEVAVEKLKRKYGCEVELKTPKVPYRETIRSTASMQGKYKKQSGGRGQYGDIWLEVAPLARGSGFEFIDAITGGVIPRQYIPSVEKGVKEALTAGVLAGYPVVDLRVKLYDGSFHTVDSSDMAFKIAASIGFKKAMEAAKPVILEPIMKMEIIVPDENMGVVVGDVNSRRGKVLGVEPKRGAYSIKALVPMAEVINYSGDLKGITQDRGIFTMEFSHYDEVPGHLSQKIIEAAKKGREETGDEGK